jgi:hypothetical protein
MAKKTTPQDTVSALRRRAKDHMRRATLLDGQAKRLRDEAQVRLKAAEAIEQGRRQPPPRRPRAS